LSQNSDNPTRPLSQNSDGQARPNSVSKARHQGRHGCVRIKRMRQRMALSHWQELWGHSTMNLRQWAHANAVPYWVAYRAYRDNRLPVFAYKNDKGLIIVNPCLVVVQKPLRNTKTVSNRHRLKAVFEDLLSQAKAQLI